MSHLLELADPTLTFSLIEDLLDTLPTEHAPLVFDYLESRVDKLTLVFSLSSYPSYSNHQGMEPNKGRGLILLRFCNEIMRRLSKVKNTVFCGRILSFLASVFPSSERSGVNLRGDFNVENTTVFEDLENAMDVDDTKEEKEKRELFKFLWSIQKYMSNPTLLFQKDPFFEFKSVRLSHINELIVYL